MLLFSAISFPQAETQVAKANHKQSRKLPVTDPYYLVL